MTAYISDQIDSKRELLKSWQRELQLNENGMQQYAARAIETINKDIARLQKDIDDD